MKNTLIQIRRIKLGIENQKEVAELLGVARATVRAIEEGQRTPSLKLAVKMAELYKCTVDDICKDLNLK